MTDLNKKYEVAKSKEDRLVEALESIASSMRNIERVIVSDPGDEQTHIYRVPDDVENIP